MPRLLWTRRKQYATFPRRFQAGISGKDKRQRIGVSRISTSVLMSTNGLAGVQSDLAPCTVEAQFLCKVPRTPCMAVFCRQVNCYLPPYILTFGGIYPMLGGKPSAYTSGAKCLHRTQTTSAPANQRTCTDADGSSSQPCRHHQLPGHSHQVGLFRVRRSRRGATLPLRRNTLRSRRSATLPAAWGHVAMPCGSAGRLALPGTVTREICMPRPFAGKTEIVCHIPASVSSGNFGKGPDGASPKFTAALSIE